MALFQLDPESIASRVRAGNAPVRVPSLGASVLRGIVGFIIVSVAGFAPWPIFERWIHGRSEVDLYVACTAVFVGLSGLCLHRLIIGPDSLSRFYKLFSLAFPNYAIAWVAFWMWLRGDSGSIAGLAAGTIVMGVILAIAFDAQRSLFQIIVALFVFNAFGYFAGGWIEGKLISEHRVAAMLLWGACYGAGFGAGLGIAFYFCQGRVRTLLGEYWKNSSDGPSS
jgi:hypothetical protein